MAQRVHASGLCLRLEDRDEGDYGVVRESCSVSPTLRSSGALGW
ncbi:MAG TPA: hypothetical protein VH643_25405 [Gemmataceae bacterium]